jgi:hypothetical protein
MKKRRRMRRKKEKKGRRSRFQRRKFDIFNLWLKKVVDGESESPEGNKNIF